MRKCTFSVMLIFFHCTFKRGTNDVIKHGFRIYKTWSCSLGFFNSCTWIFVGNLVQNKGYYYLWFTGTFRMFVLWSYYLTDWTLGNCCRISKIIFWDFLTKNAQELVKWTKLWPLSNFLPQFFYFPLYIDLI